MSSSALRLVLRLVAAVASLAAAHAAAAADPPFPTRPITIVVPLAVGGVTDIFARVTAQQLQAQLGGQAAVVVQNKSGGNGVIATSYVAQSKPDGYTLLLAIPSLAIDPALGRKLPYHALKDFDYIGLIGTSPNYLVVSSTLPVTDVRSFLDLVHRNPGKYNYGHPGVGTTAHLSFEIFKLAAGLDVHAVSYRGTAPMITDLASGQVAMTTAAAPIAMSESKAGRVRVLATTAIARTAEFPDVPTMQEIGFPSATVDPWFGLVAPAGVPEGVLRTLSAALARAVASPEVKKALALVGGETHPATPAEFRELVEKETVKWTDVVRKTGVVLDE